MAAEPTKNAREAEAIDEPAAKRVKVQDAVSEDAAPPENKKRERVLGVAHVKEEYLIQMPGQRNGEQPAIDDDAAEGRTAPDPRDNRDSRDSRDARDGGRPGRQKKKGQNKDRRFGNAADKIRLCNTRAFCPEFSPNTCRFGDRCNRCHDLRKYLDEGRRTDLETFNGKCPVFEAHGKCFSGWRCLYVRSHMKEIEHEDGRKELVLVEDQERMQTTETTGQQPEDDGAGPGTVNVVSSEVKHNLERKRIVMETSDTVIKWLDKEVQISRETHNRKGNGEAEAEVKEELRAQFIDPPLKPSEKKRLYFGRETPVLAPLTTQGNLPFRRLCVELGCQGTYSEMALALPIVQGHKSEWALMKAHESEVTPPRYTPGTTVVKDYDNSRDIKFGAQISASAHWAAVKAAEALTTHLPHLRLIDVNCGCPIDLVFKSGAGSALLDAPVKLERMIRGMNIVSKDVPITAKLRIGVKDGYPTAKKNIERLAFGSENTRDRLGAPGCAAITLHGRTRQQRYRKLADWSYIAECATLVKSYNDKRDELTDTAREPEENTTNNGDNGKIFFLGNGDCYSHVDYNDHIDNAGVDTVMIGRGALLKPWLFEEIEKGQYLDKSATERLSYVEKFARYGMDAWGSDEMGIAFTRRFMLEYLSFTYRYVPIGILEHLPPSLQDRPPAYRGRNDLETLLASPNYKDWIKISEMFLGPAHPGFQFEPKHKANSYEMEGEG